MSILRNFILLILLLIGVVLCKQQQQQQQISLSQCLDTFIPNELKPKLHLMEPDIELKEQLIISTSKTHYEPNKLYYLLTNLKPNTQYSVRISYIASSPAEFSITFFDNILIRSKFEKILSDGEFVGQDNNLKRGLLNTEIIKFKTNENGMVIEESSFMKLLINPCSVIVVESLNAGITPKFIHENDKNRLQSFNIILDTEDFLIPPQLPKVIIFALVTVAIFFILVVGKLFPKIKGLQHIS